MERYEILLLTCSSYSFCRYLCTGVSHCGEGSYGIVYKATDTRTGRAVAVKKIRMEISNQGIDRLTLREITILRTLNHPNVVKLQDAVIGSTRCFLVFDFIPQNLHDYIHAAGQKECLSHDKIRVS